MAAMDGALQRNLAMELVRATEAAALGAGRWVGRGDKNAADGGAVDAMRAALDSVQMDGLVVIGEGEKDEAPMLFNGEHIGTGEPPAVDIAVDPIDGTTLTSLGRGNAVSVIAVTARGQMNCPREVVYMNKLAVGPEAKGAIDIRKSLTENLENIARAKGLEVRDLTVVMLDRDRHAELVKEVRASGARWKSITDGDVIGAISAAMPGTGVDVLVGTGGAPEAVIAAAALKCIGGEMQCQLYPRNDKEREACRAAGLDLNEVYDITTLTGEGDAFFAATGVTDGEMLQGVRYFAHGATTESLVMRYSSGTIRRVHATHDFRRLDKMRVELRQARL